MWLLLLPQEKKQMVTYNKELLMAFVYFDQSHCGYLLERDLEEILYTLGLHLSRAQVNILTQTNLIMSMVCFSILIHLPTHLLPACLLMLLFSFFFWGRLHTNNQSKCSVFRLRSCWTNRWSESLVTTVNWPTGERMNQFLPLTNPK